MSDFSSSAASTWKHLSANAVRLFHTYANWLVGISWKRFLLLSLLLLIGAGVLSGVLPSWTVTELRVAPAPPKASASPRPPHVPSIRIDKGSKGPGQEDMTISIDKDGVRIGPRARAVPDAVVAQLERERIGAPPDRRRPPPRLRPEPRSRSSIPATDSAASATSTRRWCGRLCPASRCASWTSC